MWPAAERVLSREPPGAGGSARWRDRTASRNARDHGLGIQLRGVGRLLKRGWGAWGLRSSSYHRKSQVKKAAQ